MGYGQRQIRITHLFSSPPSLLLPLKTELTHIVNSHCDHITRARYFWSRLVWVRGTKLTWLCNLEIPELYHFSLWFGSRELWTKTLHTKIAHYSLSSDCPICTSVVSPRRRYCSLNKVRTYTHGELPTFTQALPSPVYIFSALSLLAGPDGGSWPVPSQGSQGIFHGVLSARQQQQAVSDPSLLPGLLTTRTAYALGTLDARPARLHLCLCGQI